MFTGQPDNWSPPEPEPEDDKPTPTTEAPRKYPDIPDDSSPPDTCDTSYDAISVIRREIYIFKGKVK